jgi:hypothetical protein
MYPFTQCAAVTIQLALRTVARRLEELIENYLVKSHLRKIYYDH